MRVYVPLTTTGLARVLDTGEAGPAPLAAYAVTPALREWYATGDEEELEYAALGRAAQASLRLLAAEPDVPRRRVVVAADVDDGAVEPAPGRPADAAEPGLVRLGAPVPLRLLAAVHSDDEDAAADVARAADAVEAADAGDEDARSAVDGAADHELLWYGVQEIDRIV
ncbi:DUF6912 family protein [Streptomyces avicenniae]|uniref:DUF6912 family protein n=1 Tax=Streptomyces avicenniae TaxID=500153 RepID=UPI00069B6857|nr:hypothetical protein [Streptomyces avicenniae]